jgi:hypothetical protein
MDPPAIDHDICASSLIMGEGASTNIHPPRRARLLFLRSGTCISASKYIGSEAGIMAPTLLGIALVTFGWTDKRRRISYQSDGRGPRWRWDEFVIYGLDCTYC